LVKINAINFLADNKPDEHLPVFNRYYHVKTIPASTDLTHSRQKFIDLHQSVIRVNSQTGKALHVFPVIFL
jgi:hypothetical protein